LGVGSELDVNVGVDLGIRLDGRWICIWWGYVYASGEARVNDKGLGDHGDMFAVLVGDSFSTMRLSRQEH
jgi:hypothetical protein